MSLLDRTNEISKESPSSLLPPDPVRGRDEPPPATGPSSLLQSESEHLRQVGRGPEVVKLSPGELLPDSLPSSPARKHKKWIVSGMATLAVIAVLALAVPRLTARSTSDLMEDAKTALNGGKFQDALVHLKNVLQREQAHGEARFLLGRTHMARGDLVAAESEFRAALAAGWAREQTLPALGRALLLQGQHEKLLADLPSPLNVSDAFDMEISVLRGLAYLASRNTEEASVLFTRALAHDARSVDALLGMARLAATQGRIRDAEATIDQALAIDAQSLDAQLLKADAYLINGRTEDAMAIYKEILTRYPANPQARLSMAWMEMRAGRLQAASTHAEVARKVLPNSHQANYLHALLEFRRQHFSPAWQSVVRAMRSSPADGATLILAGSIAYALGKYPDAQQLLLQGLVRLPAHIDGRKLYASTLLKRRQASAALRVLLPTLRIAPDDPDLMTIIAQTYVQTGDHASAISYLEKAVQLRPDDLRTRAALGVSQISSGQFTGAMATLEKGLRSDADTSELYSLMVVLQLSKRDIPRAEHYWQALSQRKPNAAGTLQLKGALLAAKKDLPGARKALEEALMLETMYMPALLGLAHLDLEENDPLNARRRLEKALRPNPNNIEILTTLAELAPKIKASEQEVRDWLGTALKINPASPRAAGLLARRLLESGDPKQALETIRDARREYPENAELLDLIAAAQYMSGDMHAALGSYIQLTALRPRSAEVLFRLGETQAASGSSVAAAATFRKVLELQPDHLGALAATADVHRRNERYEEALAISKRLRAKPEAVAASWTIEGDVLDATGKFEPAAAAHEQAFKAAPSTVRMLRLYRSLERSGRIRDADNLAAKWLDSNPKDWTSMVHIADAYFRRNDLASAKSLYTKVVSLRPDFVRARNNLAWIMFQDGDARARQHAEEAYRLAPNDPTVLDTLGVLLTQQGELSRAIELLERATSGAPGSVDIRLHLARALIKSGNFGRARGEIESILKRDPPAAKQEELKILLKTIPY